MAFDIRSLDPLGSGSGGKMAVGTYITSDTITVIETDGYFDEAYGSLQTGSLIAVTSSDGTDGGTKVYILTVTSNDVALTNLISDVEATLADHETRITALEAA